MSTGSVKFAEIQIKIAAESAKTYRISKSVDWFVEGTGMLASKRSTSPETDEGELSDWTEELTENIQREAVDLTADESSSDTDYNGGDFIDEDEVHEDADGCVTVFVEGEGEEHSDLEYN
ncbi:BZIP family transcription factor [Purpureocillium lavendulum]|uniref:BZIP family transcription factor n=1 Tax=Purpureocillium lavendulum TaxID=1247861 RepID=A0AB34FJH9_9HYPO|nr:BZIP family transcription factor [Purpureocillium lavendulum]